MLQHPLAIFRSRCASSSPTATASKIPHFERVLIETSGLADISPILQTFSTDRALGGEFAIEVVLAVVDAVSGLKNLDKAPEARKQAILADRIVVSKSDLSDIRTVKKLTARLKELNPRAVIDVAVKGDIDPKVLTDTGQADAIERHSGFIAEASHSDGFSALSCARRRRWNGRCFTARWKR